jgi:hypothetical protein
LQPAATDAALFGEGNPRTWRVRAAWQMRKAARLAGASMTAAHYPLFRRLPRALRTRGVYVAPAIERKLTIVQCNGITHLVWCEYRDGRAVAPRANLEALFKVRGDRVAVKNF